MYAPEQKQRAIGSCRQTGNANRTIALLGYLAKKTPCRWTACNCGTRPTARKRSVHFDEGEKEQVRLRVRSGERTAGVARAFAVAARTVCSIAKSMRREKMPPMPGKRTMSLDDLPDDVEELKKVRFDLQLENDVMREAVKLVKRPRRRPEDSGQQGEDGSGRSPEGDAFAELSGDEARCSAIQLPLRASRL